jgi:hypothetical protein
MRQRARSNVPALRARARAEAQGRQGGREGQPRLSRAGAGAHWAALPTSAPAPGADESARWRLAPRTRPSFSDGARPPALALAGAAPALPKSVALALVRGRARANAMRAFSIAIWNGSSP